MRYVVKTFHGLEPVLEKELHGLGINATEVLNRAVAFEGNQEQMYRVNLHARTALRVLQPIASFRARDEDQLYKKVHNFNWSKYLTNDQTFAIDSTVSSEIFRHSKFVALKMKDAIVDQFRDRTGARPSVDTRHPWLRLNVHVYEHEFTISLDTSGSSLHQRGYRDPNHPAPLNEALAAGMILLAGWEPDTWFHDPMCGSGTLLAEAAMIARNIAPRAGRRDFGFMRHPGYDEALWQQIKQEAEAAENNNPLNISGGDIDERAIKITRNTLRQLNIGDDIRVDQGKATDYFPRQEGGMIMMNPPYGERLQADGPAHAQTRSRDGFSFEITRVGEQSQVNQVDPIVELYSSFGDHLKRHFSGWEAWIISSNVKALKRVGLRPSRKLTLYNGALECRFQQFSMYEGSKKASKQDRPRF